MNKLRKLRNKDAAALKAEDGIFFDIDEDSTEPEDVEYDESEYDVIEETSDTTAHQSSISTYHVSGNVKLYAFNDKAFISLNTSESTIEETKQLAKQYLSQTKDKSYVATPAFRDLKDQKGDIRGVLSMAKFLDSSYGKSMTENIVGLSDATNIDGIDMKKCYMLYSVSFETGEVVGTMTYGSEDKEILKKLKKLAEEVSPKSVQDDLVKFLPKDSYMTSCCYNQRTEAPRALQQAPWSQGSTLEPQGGRRRYRSYRSHPRRGVRLHLPPTSMRSRLTSAS